MEHFMRRAVQLAVANVQEGGQPFGAVLVKDGSILAEGVNQLHQVHDVSGHAEMLAIRQAQKHLQTDDLSDCTMYASGEPCPMCFAAMQYAGIKTAYYAQSGESAKEAGLGKGVDLYAELSKPREERKLKMIHTPIEENQLNPMTLWHRQKEAKE